MSVTGKALMSLRVHKSPLPKEYDWLKYIQGTTRVRGQAAGSLSNVAYIELGLGAPQNSYIYKMTCSTGNPSGEEGWIEILMHKGGGTSLGRVLAISDGIIMYRFWGTATKAAYLVDLDAQEKPFECILTASSFTVNGVQGRNIGTYDYQAAKYDTLFWNCDLTETRLSGYLRMYHFSLTTTAGGTIRDMYPARRKSDGVIGMYDIANDVFYTSSGAAFIAGPKM